MTIYAIGDIQGCFFALEKLLREIQFDSSRDKLWLTGDLVNRGQQSLETVRFIKSLGENQQIVLGNHDLHLLAVAFNAHKGQPDDTFHAFLSAPDRDELIHWLLQQPLFHHDVKSGFTLVHAGLAPSWDLKTSQRLANEVETILKSNQCQEFFQHMYGNEPNAWNETLQGWDRIRCITNYFTRARFCHADGSLELKTKENMPIADTKLIPWFRIADRANANLKIIFGHWAALGGVTNTPNVYALDTGCVWGYCLTAMRLEDGKRFSVKC